MFRTIVREKEPKKCVSLQVGRPFAVRTAVLSVHVFESVDELQSPLSSTAVHGFLLGHSVRSSALQDLLGHLHCLY